MKAHAYASFLEEAMRFIPRERVYTDELRRLAWGTDASFYRQIPQVVIRSMNEEEVSRLLKLSDKYELPVTFRAAGTSLSGQSISDSILIVAGKHWEKYSISPDQKSITLQPGLIGQRVNEILAPMGLKFPPDPASIKSAMVGGIVMNNASGMNCGTHANSDKVMISARIVLTDGTVLDTGDPKSRDAFMQTHGNFVKRIAALRDKILANEALTQRIRYKYSIKNVTGLNLRPFVEYEDPFDIIAHCMVGSEGTLAFLSEVTMETAYNYPYKASAMLYFRTIEEACKAVVVMKKIVDADGDWLVKSAELLDWKSLASVEDPVYLRFRSEQEKAGLPTGGLTAVLTEAFGHTHEELHRNISVIVEHLKAFDTYVPVHFTDDPAEYSQYWAIRSGIFPSVGGTRKQGTTCLIEDVAFHIEDLPQATAELQELIAKHGYDDACIYGHALEGNYHFIINQSFHTNEEVLRYERLMDDVKVLVVNKYDGSLKAEHGTGRNMAPFVKDEWGEEAFACMKELKDIFDPKGLLNPGVIFNDDPKCHIKNFKPLPHIPIDEHHPANNVNKCIECGFCEVNCLSCGFTLSSRQRIVLQREITRLLQSGENPDRLKLLDRLYRYEGDATCAGDGLCSMSCPMGINVGDLTHFVREQKTPHGSWAYKAGAFAAGHFAGVKGALRPVLGLADFGHSVLGTNMMQTVAKGMHRMGMPLWTPAMPKPYKVPGNLLHNQRGETERKVVYFPSCINQTMGLAKNSPATEPLVNKMVSLLHKAGYEIIFPKDMDKLCCGTIWESKGMEDIANEKSAELGRALLLASEGGKYPVLCDQSPCLHRMRATIKNIKLYEPAEFIETFLVDKLVFTPKHEPIAVHVTCSTRKMGLANTIIALAKRCSTQVVVPEGVGCCGFAGDKGFTQPELNSYALRNLRPQLVAKGVKTGYSNSRTCEIGLTTNAGISYLSIAYLVDECTAPLAN